MIEGARADAGRARLQGLHRTDHAPDQEQAGDSGNGKAHEEQHHSALHRGVDRRERLRDREVDENEPAERVDRGRGGQHLLALQTAPERRLDRRALRTCCGRPRRLDLRQAGNIGLLQHQADVGVRNQPALRVDDVGAATLAHLDGRYDVPDELQVGLRRDHPRVLAAARKRDGHVRLGLLAEVHRAEVGLAGDRLLELGILGEVRVAAHDIHRQARDAQLLVARGIVVADFRDGRCMPQEAQRVEPALIQRDPARAPGRLRDPGQLVLQLAHELLDARGCGQRLLALDLRQRGLVLPVGEVDLHHGADHQCAAHQQHQRNSILEEKAASTHCRLVRHQGRH